MGATGCLPAVALPTNAGNRAVCGRLNRAESAGWQVQASRREQLRAGNSWQQGTVGSRAQLGAAHSWQQATGGSNAQLGAGRCRQGLALYGSVKTPARGASNSGQGRVCTGVLARAGNEGLQTTTGEVDRGTIPAAPLVQSPPSCCSGEVVEREPETSTSANVSISGMSSTVDGAGLQKALIVAALVGLPVAAVALNPSLLPFDLDDAQDWLDEAVYFASHEINRTVNAELGAANPLAPGLLGLVFGAGLITSFAPCTLSVLPLTIGYIAGFNSAEGDGGDKAQSSVVVNSVFFALGLATTFSALGITAALAGKAYGQMGPGLPMAVSGVTMYMGLNLLGLVQFRVPSLFANFDAKEAAASLPVPVQMFLGGMTFALLASPCSTPVLASLLGYVASSEDVLVGFVLLLAYTFGRVMPVLVAASFTGSMKQLLSLRQYSKWINPGSGALLLGIGTFSLLNRVFPETTALALGMGHM